MNIGVDISQVVYKGTGVARYTSSLIEALLTDNSNSYTYLFSGLRQKLSSSLESKIREKSTLKKLPFPPTLLDMVWNNIHKLPVESVVGNVDLYFASDWTSPPSKKAKKITTVHDMVVYKYPETSTKKLIDNQKNRLDLAAKEYDLLLCDSQATKQDVLAYLPVDAAKLRVLYPYVEINTHSITDCSSKYTDKFILAVGTVQPRKNIKRLIQAFTACNAKDVKLYIVGLQGWGETLEYNHDQVRFLGYVPDEELYYLYKNALCFISPSLYEGFGYPVVEAMNFGCPVAASNTSSLRELVEGYGLLFDPTSVEEISRAIDKLVSDKSLRQKLSEKSKTRAKDFTKKKFTSQLLAIFKELS